MNAASLYTFGLQLGSKTGGEKVLREAQRRAPVQPRVVTLEMLEEQLAALERKVDDSRYWLQRMVYGNAPLIQGIGDVPSGSFRVGNFEVREI